MRGSRRLLLCAAGLLLLAPATASAHTTIPGAGAVANGFLHPFTVPAHVMLLIVMGLLIAQARPYRPGLPLLGCALGALFGLGMAWKGALALSAPVLIGCTLVLALCVVCAFCLPGWLRALLCAAGAGVIGLDSPPDVPTAVLGMMLGTWLALVTAPNSIGFWAAELPDKLWAQVGLRVLASWIAAASLMLLAFSLRR